MFARSRKVGTTSDRSMLKSARSKHVRQADCNTGMSRRAGSGTLGWEPTGGL
jgi:hypothetical protein